MSVVLVIGHGHGVSELSLPLAVPRARDAVAVFTGHKVYDFLTFDSYLITVSQVLGLPRFGQ